MAFTTTRSFNASVLQKGGGAILLHQCLSVPLCFCFVSFEPDIESGASLGLAQGTPRTSFVVQTGNQFYCTLVWIGSETFTVFSRFGLGSEDFCCLKCGPTRNLLDRIKPSLTTFWGRHSSFREIHCYCRFRIFVFFTGVSFHPSFTALLDPI